MEEFYQELERELAIMATNHAYRQTVPVESPAAPKVIIEGREYLNLASNNYLGLANHPALKKEAIAALDKFGTGATASRLVVGTLNLHQQVEEELARFQQAERALLFNSGYGANLGAIQTFAGRNDLVFSDKLNHASIIDGITLSKADLIRFRHNDMNHLESMLEKHRQAAGKKLIITEAVFSMDGDQAPLQNLVRLKHKYGAILMVDEAHSEGVLGPTGRGLAALENVHQEIDIHIGTLGKAFGCFGGYVAGRKIMVDYLRNKCRSFIYTTAMPPAALGGLLGAIPLVAGEEGEVRRKKLAAVSRQLREKLINLSYNTLNSTTHIIPAIIPGNEQVIIFGRRLRERGILALPMRYPTVPKNLERIRINLMADHSEEDLFQVEKAFAELAEYSRLEIR
jgi:8-amino-7-oxononanoate synthase